MKFVDPRNDVAFRKIFGNENKKGVLISFLNGILDLGGTPKEIVDVSLLNPYQVPRLEGLKQTILDIRAVDKRGITYIVEMQMFHTTAFEKRVLYYVARAYSDQLERAVDYPKLNQVIFIGLLDFVLFPKEERYQTRHLILEEKSGEQYMKDIEFNFIELPKFGKALEDLADAGIKEKWIYFVKHAEELDAVPGKLKEPVELLEAFETANKMSWSRDEMTSYDARDIYIQDERGRSLFAREEGEKAGLERGLEKGLEQGRQEEADLIIRQLRRRTGPVPTAMEDSVRALTTARLSDLGEALLDFRASSDLAAWLERA